MTALAVRFWDKVWIGLPEQCWPWLGARNGSGYGWFSMWPHGPDRAHRVAWILANGAIPIGACVLHSCDHRWCVNPGHLFLGTRRANNQDMFSKGRGRPGHLRGSSNGNSKLTESQVIAIRELYAAGHTLREIGQRFGVSISLVHNITSRKVWCHV